MSNIPKIKPSNIGPDISGSLANLSSKFLKNTDENNFDLTLSISFYYKIFNLLIPRSSSNGGSFTSSEL